jgi:hypothetical protein
VLLDLGALSDPVKRRMLDACAGLVYSFDASMTRTMTDRYVLSRDVTIQGTVGPFVPKDS